MEGIHYKGLDMELILLHGSPEFIEGEIKVNPNSPVGGKKGNYVFAQPDDIISHAYAIKNEEMIVTGPPAEWVYTIARRRQQFLDKLPKEDGRPGGYIYQVATDHFKPANPRRLEGEWISTQAAKILSRRFVTLKKIMEKGVQIFVVDNPSYFIENNISYPDGIQIFERYKAGEVGWLNQEKDGVNPILPPAFRNDLAIKPAFSEHRR